MSKMFSIFQARIREMLFSSTDRHTDRQTDRQGVDIQTDRQTDSRGCKDNHMANMSQDVRMMSQDVCMNFISDDVARRPHAL